MTVPAPQDAAHVPLSTLVVKIGLGPVLFNFYPIFPPQWVPKAAIRLAVLLTGLKTL